MNCLYSSVVTQVTANVSSSNMVSPVDTFEPPLRDIFGCCLNGERGAGDQYGEREDEKWEQSLTRTLALSVTSFQISVLFPFYIFLFPVLVPCSPFPVVVTSYIFIWNVDLSVYSCKARMHLLLAFLFINFVSDCITGYIISTSRKIRFTNIIIANEYYYCY